MERFLEEWGAVGRWDFEMDLEQSHHLSTGKEGLLGITGKACKTMRRRLFERRLYKKKRGSSQKKIRLTPLMNLPGRGNGNQRNLRNTRGEKR